MSSTSQFGGSNDSSLEHCFTNIFALTDFGGIQYQKYVAKFEKEYTNALDDPIIKSYVLCQQNNVLSTWVRSKRENTEKHDPGAFSGFNKQLWVFWYGSGDFPNATACILPELRMEDQGNWRQGLSYEIRTILFRALHNVVERCLLSKGFVRLGKWFIQPYKHNCTQDYTQYSVSFSFFLHGESTVCASLDLRQHPLVRRIGVKHIYHCADARQTLPVVLAPYGISAELVGRATFVTDKDMTDELETWAGFYPLKPTVELDNCGFLDAGLPQFMASVQGLRTQGQHKYTSVADKRIRETETDGKSSEGTPKFVEVIVGGFRMRYRACFVLLSDADKDDLSAENTSPVTEDLFPTSVVPTTHLGYSSQPDCTLSQNSRESKSMRLWRSRGKRIRASKMKDRHIQDGTPVSSGTLQTNLLFDVRRIYFADRSLDRSSHVHLLPTTNKRTWSTEPETPNPTFVPTDASDGDRKRLATTCSWSARSPFVKTACCCPRSRISHQLSDRRTFHANDSVSRHTLRTLVNELDAFCDHGRTSQPSSNVLVPHDPSMPTLSPQQPTSLIGTNLTPVANWNRTSAEVSVPLCARSDVISAASVSSSALNAPPPLSSASVVAGIDTVGSTSATKIPPPSSVDSSNQLPSGLVLVDRPTSPSNQAVKSRDSTASLAVVKRSFGNLWLTECAQQEYHFATNEIPRRPNLQLDPVDEDDWHQLPTVDQLPISLPDRSASPFKLGSFEDSLTCEDSAPRAKRARLCWRGLAGDLFDGSSEDPQIPSSLEQCQNSVLSFDPVPVTPEAFFEASEAEPLEDDRHGALAMMDLSLCSTAGPTSTSSLLGRTLGLLPHKGVSLASSTGSGHLGPAELALMLPTPPSHDAPQPSPVDGVAVVGANVRSSASNTADSPVSLPNTTVLSEPIVTPHDPACNSAVWSQRPQPQHLLSLAKQCCIQTHHFGNLDPNQDWSFTRSYTAYFGIASGYQISRHDANANWKRLPTLPYAFDHRAQNTKASFLSTFVDSTTGGCFLRTATSPAQLPHPKSGSVSPTFSITNQSREAPFDNKPPSPHSLSAAAANGAVAHLADSSVTSAYVTEELAERLIGLLKASGILVNLALSDSMLNLFKDHNFDSCNICECTSSVLGNEIDVYLSNSAPQLNPSNGRPQRTSLGSNGGGFGAHDLVGASGFGCGKDCKCGFSAVMNQKYVVNGNLFYEDEIEVTSLRFLSASTNDGRSASYSVVPNYKRPPGWWQSSTTYEHLLLLQRIVGSVYDEFSVRNLMEFIRKVKIPCSVGANKENLLEYDAVCALVSAAFRESSKTVENQSPVTHSAVESGISVHPSYIFKAQSKIPENHNDQIRLLATMRPWLQEAISSTRLLESNYTVDGPLTWKAFHQLAGRGSDETCKPQPIPQLRVGGSEKDHLLISPFSLRDWDRLSLSPLSQPKNIAYAVILPTEHFGQRPDRNLYLSPPMPILGHSDMGRILNSTRKRMNETSAVQRSKENWLIEHSLSQFLIELSHIYENCRLGNHLPYHQPELNRPETAFIPVDPTPTKQLMNDRSEIPPDLFQSLVQQLQGHCDSPEAFVDYLQSYVRAAFSAAVTHFEERGITVPTAVRSSGSLQVETSDLFPTSASQRSNTVVKKDFDKENDLKSKIRSSAPRTGKILGHSSTNPRNGQGPLTSSLDSSSWVTTRDTYLVIYFLNPFSQICDMNPKLFRIIMQAFVSCANKILTALPESWQPRVNIQFLSLDHLITDYLPRLRSVALALYSSVDRYIEPSLINANRTLTGMGPAAEKEVITNERESSHRRTVKAPPYVLVGTQELFGQWDLPPSDPFHRSCVLFVAYCLSQDQQWLLASFTDEQGSLLDQTLINIRVPSTFFSSSECGGAQPQQAGSEGKRIVSPRRIGLLRLWDYMINLISRTANPWRLVVGRVGRLGHGELKGWNGLLGRKSLQDVNRFFRDRCSTCNLSACVSSQPPGGSKATLNLVNSASGSNSCTHELPSLISACLVSLEPQSTFRIYPGLGLSPEDAWALGGGGGGGGGGSGVGGGNTSSSNSTSAGGNSGTCGGYTPSAFGMRTTMMVGNAMTSNEVPSATHILVFPTSTSASGLSVSFRPTPFAYHCIHLRTCFFSLKCLCAITPS
ncbi:mediator complex subunit Srb9 [Clonorchis sinensis]|uniref:Mediator of RNA polymerase II transcription subunit 13 n=1 Tax=Clonorchis sinensis TaxID=79923 RepID=A0A8T1MP43_CLOSI|nr:mediator complex subunit Srb9 [Clonorchis sinensis]